ncbi:ABC transporter substrate-binding protein [Polycladidibacter hongkongensis]|uniref:ABC transporter substrate-binding protein n=1 Tax=Polycladidibacter hongkongensis TaxID=1647556 RepID=UPI00082C8B43|nr:ABC transporter substrate-binding protein [Pseudovibrio hongkongensis]
MRLNSLTKLLKRVALPCLLSVACLAGNSHASDHASLNIGMQLEPPHLDPTAGAAGAIDAVTYANIFEGLTRIGAHGEVLPALARSWKVSPDGLSYTFYLAKGVQFHDGSPFSADDVKFSLDRARGDGSTNAQKPLFSAIKEVVAVAPNEVRVDLLRQEGSLLFNLGWGDAVIVSRQSAKGNRKHPIGTGPFQFSRWVKGQEIQLQRFDHYWGSPAKLDTVRFKVIADPNAAIAAVMAGDVDAYPGFPAPEALGHLEADPRFKVFAGSSEGETILAMNNKAGPLADVRVRRAVSMAIDKQALVEGAMYGYGTPITSHFAPHHPAALDLAAETPFDVREAKHLLKQAGYEDGFTATLKLPPPSYARRGGELIASDLSKIGIKLKIVPVEWAQWLADVFKGKNYEFTIVSHTEPMDIGIYARKDYYFNYDSAEFDGVVKQLNAASDTQARYSLLGEAQRIIARDAVNAYLFQLANVSVWNAKLEGMWKDAPIQAIDVTHVHWQD